MTVDGQKIVRAYVSYANIVLVDDHGNEYYMSTDMLLTMVSEFTFKTTKKITRTHITETINKEG